MTTLTETGWHPGEQAIHKILRIPAQDNPTVPGLRMQWAYRISGYPLMAFGTLDGQGRPWTTIWGGEAGFCRPLAENVLGARSTADVRFDPVLRELFAVEKKTTREEEEVGGGEEESRREIVDDEVVRPEGVGKLISALSMNPEVRSRVKFAGRFIAGSVARTESGAGELQMAIKVEESLAQCPKYISKKRITPHIPSPHLISSQLPLPDDAVTLIRKADMFFISSKHSDGTRAETMDTNVRGGPPGFVRVLRNEKGGATLVWPEYSGNRLYQTLGNLQANPCAGVVVPDFETSDALYVTGRTTILVGEQAATCMPRAKVVVKLNVDEAVFVRDSLPLRGTQLQFSPYNPPVRRLAVEQEDKTTSSPSSSPLAVATLTNREVITPTISQFTFNIRPGSGKDKVHWLPGQHVTLDFSQELDQGYSHMRDEDPQSLNDDFVRTFTVSGPPPSHADAGDDQMEMQLTVRKHGAATSMLWRWNLRVPLELPVLGFGGSEGFRLPVAGEDGSLTSGHGSNNTVKEGVFVAGGVGITPLMAQAGVILDAAVAGAGGSKFRLLWTLRGEDLPLAVRVLGGINGLGGVTRLFVTGTVEAAGTEMVARLKSFGVDVEMRRICRSDVLAAGERRGRKFYVCTGPELMRALQEWTEGEEVETESFAY